MYVNPESDPKLYQFIQALEQDAPNKKGYVVDKIKEILRAWAGFVDLYGEKDVLMLTLQLASGKQAESRSTETEQIMESIAEPSESIKKEAPASKIVHEKPQHQPSRYGGLVKNSRGK
jgi:hypothetical protein